VRAVPFIQLAMSVRQRADLDGQQQAFGSNSTNYITDQEVTVNINQSVTKLWDILIGKHGDNYAWGTYYIPVTQGVYSYPLPTDFYKEAGVDLALDTTMQNWASIRPFTLRDRNLFSFPLQTALAYAGWQNVRFQIQGNQLYFLPQVGPLPGQVRVLYFPQAPTLCATLPIAYPASTAIAQYQLVYASITPANGVATNQVFMALNAGTSGASPPSWNVPGTVTDSGGITWAYTAPLSTYGTTFDGINGYEEIIVLDSALKSLVKQEADTSAIAAQLAAEMQRIDLAAANRQAGDPMVISGGFGMCEGGPAYGNGFGPFGGY
jgi:hypothetical protein